MMFRKIILIETTKYLYENQTYTRYDVLHFIKSSHLYVPWILTLIKARKFTPFDDGGIKDWYILQVNTEKVSSILRKCKSVFKKLFMEHTI